MNNDITRLRRLRQAALKARAFSSVLNTGEGTSPILDRGALLNWRIARIATGQLRAHPFKSYQRDPSLLEIGVDRCIALAAGIVANLRSRRATTFFAELRSVARLLDDTRALTLSPDLSDALGRAQAGMRTLLKDVHVEALREAQNLHKVGFKLDVQAVDVKGLVARPLPSSSYLAL